VENKFKIPEGESVALNIYNQKIQISLLSRTCVPYLLPFCYQGEEVKSLRGSGWCGSTKGKTVRGLGVNNLTIKKNKWAGWGGYSSLRFWAPTGVWLQI
jgi:hypothetical protein